MNSPFIVRVPLLRLHREPLQHLSSVGDAGVRQTSVTPGASLYDHLPPVGSGGYAGAHTSSSSDSFNKVAPPSALYAGTAGAAGERWSWMGEE